MAEQTIKYTGDGVAHHVGVPMRDLAEHEFLALADELKALVREGGLYAYAAYEKVARRRDQRADKAEAEPAQDVPAASAAKQGSDAPNP